MLGALYPEYAGPGIMTALCAQYLTLMLMDEWNRVVQ